MRRSLNHPPRWRLIHSAIAYTSSAEKATMALRRGRREILRSPANDSVDSRGRSRIGAPGSNSRMIGAIVAEPISSVSSAPRRLRIRSVKTWPRSKSVASWISSTATNDTDRSRGMASTVDTQ